MMLLFLEVVYPKRGEKKTVTVRNEDLNLNWMNEKKKKKRQKESKEWKQTSLEDRGSMCAGDVWREGRKLLETLWSRWKGELCGSSLQWIKRSAHGVERGNGWRDRSCHRLLGEGIQQLSTIRGAQISRDWSKEVDDSTSHIYICSRFYKTKTVVASLLDEDFVFFCRLCWCWFFLSIPPLCCREKKVGDPQSHLSWRPKDDIQEMSTWWKDIIADILFGDGSSSKVGGCSIRWSLFGDYLPLIAKKIVFSLFVSPFFFFLFQSNKQNLSYSIIIFISSLLLLWGETKYTHREREKKSSLFFSL